jgi:hypothetical protein
MSDVLRTVTHEQWQVEAWKFSDPDEFRRRPPVLGWFPVGWYGTEVEALEGLEEFRQVYANVRLVEVKSTEVTSLLGGFGEVRKVVPEPEGSDWQNLQVGGEGHHWMMFPAGPGSRA